ncbi:hypothetical protein [Pseudomonas simiae]|uniref:hypothetical protein n=1 Tax=Pseudomonas simiae TaxID=321846 RepID=UPI00161C4CF9|nr:hypothetical protein [Pseudomonas simiae]
MIIKLSPCRCEESLTVSKRSDVLTINGERFDFREIPEGAVLPASAVECEFVIGDVTRKNGELTITLLLPYGPDATKAAKFPADIVSPPDGNVSLPQ